MNIKNFTLKAAYVLDGKEYTVTESDDTVVLRAETADNGVKVFISSKVPVKLTLAELIYDRFYESNERFFANGYQSWTTSREYKRGDFQYGLRNLSKLPVARDFSGASGDYRFTEYGRGLYHGFTYAYLRKDDKLEFLGSLNERTGYTIFYADMLENVFAIVKDVEGLEFKDEYELFDIAYFCGTYDEVFDAYFAAFPEKATGRVEHFAGYTSWYNYYQNINEEIILRDLKGLKRAGASANIFQIDDGYETRVGDWKIDEVKFPNGLRSLSDKIHAQNLKAGLWFAPFAAEFKADIVKSHPEWLIKKTGKNRPLISGAAWGGFYALDFEIPEVKSYIRAFFDKVFGEWNFDMVKLDFLYAACILPRNGKTRGQLMCEAMDFLRDCCGDKIILGCGVPLGPSFGKVDACRISCDVELSFNDRYYTSVTNQEIISAKMAMNNSIFRRHLNGRIFANDPDVCFLRDGGMTAAKFTWEQKMLLAKINNMFGSVLFVSDDINEYGDKQLAALKEFYKKFDGKVLSAEYVGADIIRIDYEHKGNRHRLTFNALSGENSVETL